MRERPIFVLGYPRSGTTLLQSLLGSHPRIAAPPETHFVARISQNRRYFGDLSDDANLRRAVRAMLEVPGGFLDESGFDESRVFDRARRSARTYGGLLDALMGDFAQRSGKPRWSEKTPGQRLHRLIDLFDDAQFVHIVRDPRDAIASSVRLPGPPRSVRARALEWRSFVLDTIRDGSAIGPGQYLQVRYEDLVADPNAVLRVVCAFLGESYDEEMLHDSEGRRASTQPGLYWMRNVTRPVGESERRPWQERLGRHRGWQLAPVVGSLLPALGYVPFRRRAVVAGRLLNALYSYEDLPERRRLRHLKAVLKTPEDQFRETERYYRSITDRW